MRREIAGIPVHVDPWLPKGSIMIYDKNGPKPVIHVENESLLNTLYRAIDSDADFLKRCGVIVNLGDLPHG